MYLLPVVGLVAGFALIFGSQFEIPVHYGSYVALATLAGLDSVFGGIRAGIEGKFHDDIFLSGFLVNTALAALLGWVGEQLGVDLRLAALVVLGGRVLLADQVRSCQEEGEGSLTVQ
jgi:small basic protein